MNTSTYKLAPICNVLDCELCEHASLIYEKVYHQLHAPLEKPFQAVLNVPRIETKRILVQNDTPPTTQLPSTSFSFLPSKIIKNTTLNPPSRYDAPAINGIFTRDQGQLIAHDVWQNLKPNNLKPNNPKQELFAECISKKPRLESKTITVPSASGNFVVQQESAQFKFTPYQLHFNQENDAKKKRRFKELQKHGRTDGYYCFHKMLSQPTKPCCGQCFHIGL
jgi:hypothetical protein